MARTSNGIRVANGTMLKKTTNAVRMFSVRRHQFNNLVNDELEEILDNINIVRTLCRKVNLIRI